MVRVGDRVIVGVIVGDGVVVGVVGEGGIHPRVMGASLGPKRDRGSWESGVRMRDRGSRGVEFMPE